VAIAGASGYAGGELLRLLHSHPGVEIGALTAVCQRRHDDRRPPPAAAAAGRSGAGGDDAGPAAPATTWCSSRCRTDSPATLAHSLPADVLVLDCGADFRLVEPTTWTEFYGGEHPGTWPYGLPELPGQRDKLAGARRVAVPGCYPTVATLTLLPAVTAGLIEVDDVVIVAVSGSSGAGRVPKPNLLGAEVMGQASAYGVGGTHRHTPEIEQNLRGMAGTRVGVSFTPVLAPMARGILATCTARLRDGVDPGGVQQAYADAFAAEPFVHLLPPGRWPQTQATLGANTVQVQVAVDARAGRLVAVGAMDNLTKGTAGGAVQCMNIALGPRASQRTAHRRVAP
jgi:N-acetyl-gamma-glutamyl-phosphate reductase